MIESQKEFTTIYEDSSIKETSFANLEEKQQSLSNELGESSVKTK